MATPAIPLKEFDVEMASTRKLLERVPGDKGAWKPHDKSFSLGHLAQLVSWMPGWIATSLHEDQIDLAKQSGYSIDSTGRFSRCSTRTSQRAHGPRDGDGVGPGRAVVSQARRACAVHGAAWRGGPAASESPVHHRGQLTVYLRLVNVPLPSVYGPTADERW